MPPVCVTGYCRAYTVPTCAIIAFLAHPPVLWPIMGHVSSRSGRFRAPVGRWQARNRGFPIIPDYHDLRFSRFCVSALIIPPAITRPHLAYFRPHGLLQANPYCLSVY